MMNSVDQHMQLCNYATMLQSNNVSEISKSIKVCPETQKILKNLKNNILPTHVCPKVMYIFF